MKFFYFYVHPLKEIIVPIIKDEKTSPVRLQIWRPDTDKSKYHYMLVWEVTVNVNITAAADGAFVEVSLFQLIYLLFLPSTFDSYK